MTNSGYFAPFRDLADELGFAAELDAVDVLFGSVLAGVGDDFAGSAGFADVSAAGLVSGLDSDFTSDLLSDLASAEAVGVESAFAEF